MVEGSDSGYTICKNWWRHTRRDLCNLIFIIIKFGAVPSVGWATLESGYGLLCIIHGVDQILAAKITHGDIFNLGIT
jgi:hypothetical protein